MVPAHPINTTGLRPILSERAPQNIPLHASACVPCERCQSTRRGVLTRLKAEMSRPAKNGAFDAEETSKLRTSFQAYGSMLVRAIGSATLTSAAIRG